MSESALLLDVLFSELTARRLLAQFKEQPGQFCYLIGLPVFRPHEGDGHILSAGDVVCAHVENLGIHATVSVVNRFGFSSIPEALPILGQELEERLFN